MSKEYSGYKNLLYAFIVSVEEKKTKAKEKLEDRNLEKRP